ncbi:MAG TPA: hypothetical protein PKE55_06335 [Kiritimatiellia bacterium]|nr:hypothetical protein [Kiritimatiellia bacterium]
MKTACATAITISLLLGQSAYAQKPPKPYSPNVSPTALATVQHGMTQHEVEQQLSARGYHQFTAVVSNVVIRCVSFYRNDVYGHYYLVFTDDHLRKVCVPPAFEMRSEPYMNSRVNLRTLGNPESRIETVLESEDLIGHALTAALRPQAPPKQSVDPGLTAAFILTRLIPRSPSQKAQEREYAELLVKFDPYAIPIGADTSNVESRLGTPQIMEPLGEGREIRYYGSPYHGLRGSSEKMWLSVVYENGRVVRVFSHDFMDYDKIRPLEVKSANNRR